MIEIKNISKSFPGVDVLKDISIRFETGNVSFIIGQSGSGKSVLTKCIVGLMKPNAGEVYFDGRDFYAMTRKQQKSIRKEIGMLFQGSALFDSQTVEENIMFPLQMLGKMTKKEMLARVDTCLERVNLKGTNHLMPAELSGGMKKRVGIARAISVNPKYLFCDEPNSGLDPQTAIVIDNLIKEITKEFNITTIVVSHDMNSVIEIGDEINFIHNGSIAWSGSKEDILKAENKVLNDFVYASEFMQQVRENLR